MRPFDHPNAMRHWHEQRALVLCYRVMNLCQFLLPPTLTSEQTSISIAVPRLFCGHPQALDLQSGTLSVLRPLSVTQMWADPLPPSHS